METKTKLTIKRTTLISGIIILALLISIKTTTFLTTNHKYIQLFPLKNDQKSSIKEKEEIWKLKIKGSGEWRGVFGNDAGIKPISGKNSAVKKIKPRGKIVATIQKLTDSPDKLIIQLTRNEKIIKQKEITNQFGTKALFSPHNKKQLELEKNKLSPIRDVDNDGYINSLDPLPTSPGTVTKKEYENLINIWSQQLIPVITKTTNLVKQFNENRISKSNYLTELKKLSREYKINNTSCEGRLSRICGEGGIDDIIPPKKYAAGNFISAVEKLDQILNQAPLKNNKEEIQEIIASLNKDLEITASKNLKKLIKEINNLQAQLES